MSVERPTPPDDTEGPREQIAAKLWTLFTLSDNPAPWSTVRSHPDYRHDLEKFLHRADAVLAALAGDPGDLPARMAEAIRNARCDHPERDGYACFACRVNAAVSVRWEYAARQAAEVERMRARAEKAESELAEARMALDDVAGWETSQRLNAEAKVERLRAEQAECGLIELIELKGCLAAADEAFKDMAQTNGGVHPADALTHVARIMATLRGAETPHRVAYEQVRKEAWAEVERLEDRLRKAEGAYSMLDAQRLDAEATRDRWKARAEEAEAERDAARLIVEELQALRDSMYGQLDSAVAERDALQAAIADVRRLCNLTIDASCRVQAIDQARDTLAVLDRALDASGADHG